MKNPSTDPRFRVYFSKEWYAALKLAARNFFDEIFNGSHILLEKLFATGFSCFSLRILFDYEPA